jgi:predicted acyltransferase
VVFGVNAIALFVGSALMAKLLGVIKLPWGSTQISLQGWIFEKIFIPLASPINASLAYAIVFILIWLGLMWILYARKIFIKV